MKYTKEILTEAVSKSTTLSNVIRLLGERIDGSRHRHLRQRINHFGIDISHFEQKRICNLKRSHKLEDVLTKNRLIDRREDSKLLRKCLILAGVQEKCVECGVIDLYNNKPIRLQIDHINGDWLDNTKENLRFLCPNCHSQTSNYASKKLIKKEAPKKKYTNRYIKKGTQRLSRRPSKEELEELIWKIPTIQIAKQFEVSDKAIEKWCRFYKIEKPPRGYWTKLKYKTSD